MSHRAPVDVTGPSAGLLNLSGMSVFWALLAGHTVISAGAALLRRIPRSVR